MSIRNRKTVPVSLSVTRSSEHINSVWWDEFVEQVSFERRVKD